jgi:hypothetical protein
MLAIDSGLENSLLFHARDVLRNKISGRNCSPLILKKGKKKKKGVLGGKDMGGRAML